MRSHRSPGAWLCSQLEAWLGLVAPKTWPAEPEMGLEVCPPGTYQDVANKHGWVESAWLVAQLSLGSARIVGQHQATKLCGFSSVHRAWHLQLLCLLQSNPTLSTIPCSCFHYCSLAQLVRSHLHCCLHPQLCHCFNPLEGHSWKNVDVRNQTLGLEWLLCQEGTSEFALWLYFGSWHLSKAGGGFYLGKSSEKGQTALGNVLTSSRRKSLDKQMSQGFPVRSELCKIFFWSCRKLQGDIRAQQD